MELTFYGAAGEVTGSMHLLDTGKDRILLDCGMFQGRRKEARQKNTSFPFDPKTITNMILSHAHIDHSGRIPMLTKHGFPGRIITTRPTADALKYMLLDSGHIQESDALYLNYKSLRAYLYQLEQKRLKSSITSKQQNQIKKILKKNAYELDHSAIHSFQKQHDIDIITPLYTMEEANQSLGYIDGFPFNHKVTIGEGVTAQFYVAGHILGSAFTVITVRQANKIKKIVYTGDVGRFDKPILKDPTLVFDKEDKEIDLYITESTYGNRAHDPVQDLGERLKLVLNQTFERGGAVIIPSFAFGRTQELIYILHELYDSGQVPRRPVFIDSPLASNITTVFGEHPEVYDKETHKTFLEKGKNPFFFDKIKFIQTVQESMLLNQDKTPHVVISASGMCEAGRILHHLRYKVHDPKNTILLVGYMAEHTLGRRIEEFGTTVSDSSKDNAKMIKILGKEYPLKAQVEKIGGFSAHGDRYELEKIIEQSNLNIAKIAIVHGESSQSSALADRLVKKGRDVVVPSAGQKIKI